MVTQPSRRAFLTGRRTPATPWGQFCARLSRTCAGAVRWDQETSASQAWLEPGRAADVMHALALCSEFGVQLILLGSDACPDPLRPTLWVDSRADWAKIECLNPSVGLWRVDAGARLGSLQRQQIGVFNDKDDFADADWTVAQWFAKPFLNPLTHSGIVQAEVLLADGTLERLGPFGAQDSAPLRSLSVQKNIPRLFELAHSNDAALCANCPDWPSRYRLDALMAHTEGSPNLAWLFAGHGGSLAWLQTVWIQTPVPSVSAAQIDGSQASMHPASDTEIRHLADLLDQLIKQILDPAWVFGKTPPAKGLEST